MRRDARPLAAHGLLRDLHQQLLPLLEPLLDGTEIARGRRRGLDQGLLGVALARDLRRQRGALAGEIRGVQEGRLLEADVDEGRLHAGQYAHHLALVDVAGDAALLAALDVQIEERGVFEQRDPRLPGRGVDEDLARHVAQEAGTAWSWKRVASLCTRSVGRTSSGRPKSSPTSAAGRTEPVD